MDYKKHYDLLISKAINRDFKTLPYTEKHHIVPRSEGGTDDIYNIVRLTAREHFLAHWLLFRIDPTIKSRVFSFWRMCNGRGSTPKEHWVVISSRCYEESRMAHSEAISKALKGKKKSPEHIKKVADKIRGLKRTEEQKAKLRKPHNMSEEGKMRIINAHKSRKPANIKGVDMLDPENYKILKSFDSIKESANFMNLDSPNIFVAIKEGSISGGYRWKYSNQENYIKKEKKIVGRSIKVYKKENPEDIIIFESIKKASLYTGISSSAIHTRCNRSDNEYKGWCFEYEN